MTGWERSYGCEVASQGRLWTVSLKGEVDAAAVPLIDGILRLVAPAADRVAVDLHAVTFLDSAAIAALVRAGGGPALVRPSVIARRALEEHGAVADADPPPIGAQRHAVVATDGDGRITDWNEAAAAFFGWQPWEALGRSIAIVGVCPTDEALAHEISLVIGRGEAWDGEFDVLHRSGGTVRAHVREVLLRGGAGRPAGVLRLCSAVPSPSFADARSPQLT